MSDNFQTRFSAILSDELEFKGIDWLQFVNEDGSLRDEPLTTYMNSLYAAAGMDVVLKSVVDGADLFAPIALDKATFLSNTKNLSKSEVIDYLFDFLDRLKQMEKELDKPAHEIDWEAVGLAAAAIGFLSLFKYTPVILAGMTEAYSAAVFTAAMIQVAAGTTIAIAAITAAIAVVIAIMVVVFLMFRDAQMLIMVANVSTTNSVKLSDYYRHHGKIKVVPGDLETTNTLPAGVSKDGSDYIYVSFVNPGKTNFALYGCEGAFKVDINDANNTSLFHLYQSYAVPLTGIFGGHNGVYMGTGSKYSSSKNFWNTKAKNEVHGTLSDQIGNAVGKFNVKASAETGQQIGAILTIES